MPAKREIKSEMTSTAAKPRARKFNGLSGDKGLLGDNGVISGRVKKCPSPVNARKNAASAAAVAAANRVGESYNTNDSILIDDDPVTPTGVLYGFPDLSTPISMPDLMGMGNRVAGGFKEEVVSSASSAMGGPEASMEFFDVHALGGPDWGFDQC